MACDFSLEDLEEDEVIAAHINDTGFSFRPGEPDDVNTCEGIVTSKGREWRDGEGWVTDHNKKRRRYNLAWLDERGWL